MAIALDASTPAQVINNDGQPITASFTAPSGAVLIASFLYESSGGTPSVSDSGGLTWTAVGSVAHVGVRLWRAVTASSAARTVSAVDGNSGFGGQGSLYVMVWTGANTTTPIGNVGDGTSATNNDTVTGYTSSANNSWGMALARSTVNGTASSTDVAQAPAMAVISGLHIRKSAATAASGTGVTFNIDAPGTGAPGWDWIAAELLDAGGGGPAFIGPEPLIVGTDAALTRSTRW